MKWIAVAGAVAALLLAAPAARADDVEANRAAELVRQLAACQEGEAWHGLTSAVPAPPGMPTAPAQQAAAPPEDPTYCAMAYVADSEGRIDEAIAHYDRCLREGQLSPATAAAMHNLRGLALSRRGDFTAAVADFDAAINLAPGDSAAYLNRGAAHLDLTRYDRAVTDLAEVIRLDPGSAAAYMFRGFAYDAQGLFEAAIADYTEAIRLDPADPEAYFRRGLTLAGQGDVERALADFDRAIDRDPGHAEAYRARSYAFVQRGDIGQALEDLEQALDLEPANPSMLNDLAWLLATEPRAGNRDRKRAVRLAEKALALAPDDAVILDTVAAAYAAAGRFAEAATVQAKAIARARDEGFTADVIAQMQTRLTGYQQGKPWRE